VTNTSDRQVGTFEDVDAEERLRFQALLLEAITDSVIFTDLEGRIQYWNRGAEALFGYTAAEMTGQTPAMLYPGSGDDLLAEDLKSIMEGHDYVATWKGRRKDGSDVWVDIKTTVARNAEGTPIGMIGVGKDATVRKQAEDHFRQTDRLEAVGRLAGGIAHDLNNMLMSILGSAAYVTGRLRADSSEVAELQRLSQAANRSAKLTQQLLAFARRDMIQPQAVDVNAIVTEAVHLLKPLLGRRIELELALAPGLEKVMADKSRLDQVIVNLVLNARDAMPEGGRVTLATRSVVLGPSYLENHAQVSIKAGTYVMLAVSDTGHGMDRETLSHIFEPFFTTKPVGQGTGLGLATVYGSVKQAGGLVWAYSEPNIGTVIKIYLPAIQT
jgi:two-component system, cell cycle sensor histidine kinase and response regulator CckA